MVYILAGQHIISQLQCRSGGHKVVNAEYQGILHDDCLRKRYPCLNYLFYKDREMIQHVLDEYSDVVPDQPGRVVLTTEQFDALYEDADHVIPMKLTEDESLENMVPIMQRLAKEHNLELDLETPLCSPPPNKVIPRDMPMPIKTRSWVFLLIREWAAVECMREFEGDTDFVLMRLWDGNLMRMRKSAIDAGLLFRECNKRPLEKLAVSLDEILFNEIYIYTCIDGYYEWTEEIYRGGKEVRASLLPFRNPLCAKNNDWKPPTREFVEQAQEQLYRSGQISLPADGDRGDEILDFIFGGSLLDAVERSDKGGKKAKSTKGKKVPKVDVMSGDTSEDERRLVGEVVRPRTGMSRAGCGGKGTTINKAQPRYISAVRGECLSGITGINMTCNGQKTFWYWTIQKCIRGKKPQIHFPVRTEDPIEIERILDEEVVPRYREHLRQHGFSEEDILVMTTPNL